MYFCLQFLRTKFNVILLFSKAISMFPIDEI